MCKSKKYSHVGKVKVYRYRWYLSTEDGSFRTMCYTSKPKIKGCSAIRIINTFEYMHPDRIDGFYGFEPIGD